MVRSPYGLKWEKRKQPGVEICGSAKNHQMLRGGIDMRWQDSELSLDEQNRMVKAAVMNA